MIFSKATRQALDVKMRLEMLEDHLEEEEKKRKELPSCLGGCLSLLGLFLTYAAFWFATWVMLNLVNQHGIEVERKGEKYLIGNPADYGLPVPARTEADK